MCFPKLSDEAKVLRDDFDYFIGGVSLTSFVKHPLEKIFQIGLQAPRTDHRIRGTSR